MDSREQDAHKVHEAASEIATALGAHLMNLLPSLTNKYAISSQSFIVASVQAAMKVGASGVASVTRMNHDELVALQRDLNSVVFNAIKNKLPSLHEEHDRIWQVASDEGRNGMLLFDLSETFDRIEESLRDYGEVNY